mgnify:CR=1 FL=1
MTTVTRRKVLKSGAAVVGGMAGILATGRPPAFAQGATVHWLRWTDFVPASDQLLRNEIAKEGEKALGIKLNIETINANDIQARVTSAIQSGSGPDIVCVLNNWGQLYGESVIDVSDIAEELGKGQGGSTKHPALSPMTARNGLQCRGASSACRSHTESPGLPRSATRMENFLRRGKSIARQARS